MEANLLILYRLVPELALLLIGLPPEPETSRVLLRPELQQGVLHLRLVHP